MPELVSQSPPITICSWSGSNLQTSCRKTRKRVRLNFNLTPTAKSWGFVFLAFRFWLVAVTSSSHCHDVFGCKVADQICFVEPPARSRPQQNSGSGLCPDMRSLLKTEERLICYWHRQMVLLLSKINHRQQIKRISWGIMPNGWTNANVLGN